MMVAIGLGSAIAFNSDGSAADWIMVLPQGMNGMIATVDGRGPFRTGDGQNLQKIANESLHAAGGRIPIDENHATDLAARNGAPSPARGWVTAFDVRADGIYARVEWSATGAQLMSEKAYRFISPVITHDKANNVLRILRASLTNTPNLRGMAALHSTEKDMDLLAKLRTMLGLADDADEAAVLAKLEGWVKADKPEAMSAIAKAVGLKDDADATTVLSAVTTLAAKPGEQSATILSLQSTVTGLQAELTTVTTSLNTLQASAKKEKAIAFVDGAIKLGRVGVKPSRDAFISMHAEDPAKAEKIINAMPVLQSGALLPEVPEGERISLNMADPHAIAGAAAKYQAEQAKLGRTVNIADAVTHVKERAQ